MKRAVPVTLLCLLLAGCGNSIGTLPTVTEQTAASQTTVKQTEAPQQTETSPQTTVSDAESSTPSVTAPVTSAEASSAAETEEAGILSSPEDIGLYDTDGSGTNYVFAYGGERYSAVYTEDNWKIIDSYRITNSADMKLICEALISVHPIHGADLQSWRTSEDMVFEWQEHNSAYYLLPEDSEWKKNVKDVDFNPEDQGKTGVEMALERLNGR